MFPRTPRKHTKNGVPIPNFVSQLLQCCTPIGIPNLAKILILQGLKFNFSSTNCQKQLFLRIGIFVGNKVRKLKKKHIGSS